MDWKKFYARLDRIRENTGLTWRGLGRELGLNSCTFTRLKRGSGLSMENYFIIEGWAVEKSAKRQAR